MVPFILAIDCLILTLLGTLLNWSQLVVWTLLAITVASAAITLFLFYSYGRERETQTSTNKLPLS